MEGVGGGKTKQIRMCSGEEKRISSGGEERVG